MKSLISFIFCMQLLMVSNSFNFVFASGNKQDDRDSITVSISKINGNVYFLECINGFGGGNVAASIGDDGVLLVDDMYDWMSFKLQSAVKTISDKPIKIVLNTHFHPDHISGNNSLNKLATIIAQENVVKRLKERHTEAKPTTGMLPAVTFSDQIQVRFNGEDIRMIHFPNSHTDGDAAVYFTKSKVLHLGDMFFFEMFPAVYTEGGGNIRQLIVSLEKILHDFPSDTKVIPGHGRLATMKDLADYVIMLKETTSTVESKIKEGKTLEQMKQEKILAKYDILGSGGAQTTDQYLGMLYKLLQ